MRIKNFNAEQIEAANRPQIEATRAWAFSVLRELPEWPQLGGRYRNRLVKHLQGSVNKDESLMDPDKLSAPSRQTIRDTILNTRCQIENSRRYQSGDTAGIQLEDCFIRLSTAKCSRPYYDKQAFTHDIRKHWRKA